MQAKPFFFEKKKQKTFIHCRRHGVRTENSVPSETDKSFLVLFCKKERVALLRFQWVDLPGQKRNGFQSMPLRRRGSLPARSSENAGPGAAEDASLASVRAGQAS